MDPKGLFHSFLNPYCMCGLTFEVNIQCLLPVLPAASRRLNFVLSRMRPHSDWAHQNCLFLPQNKQNIALGPQPNLICFGEDSRTNVFHITLRGSLQLSVSCEKYSGSSRFQEQTRKLLLFLVCNKNSPEGKIKTKAKVRSPIGSVNGSLNWFMSLF